jgi:phosphohistidine phosphatase SixA
MKTLFLVRHAKSSRDDLSLPDRDRPLDDRGKQDAPKMGKRLAKRDVRPDLLLSSPALRALTTAQVMAEELGCKGKDIVVDDRLYASNADDLLAVVRALDKKLTSKSIASTLSAWFDQAIRAIKAPALHRTTRQAGSPGRKWPAAAVAAQSPLISGLLINI